jgi:hypothetical protein
MYYNFLCFSSVCRAEDDAWLAVINSNSVAAAAPPANRPNDAAADVSAADVRRTDAEDYDYVEPPPPPPVRPRQPPPQVRGAPPPRGAPPQQPGSRRAGGPPPPPPPVKQQGRIIFF